MIPALLLAAAIAIGGVTSGVHVRVAHLLPRPVAAKRRSLSRVGLSRLLAVIVGLAIALWWNGPMGIVLGIGTGLGLVAVMARMGSRVERQRDAAMRRQTPLVADLLAACVASGATIQRAVEVVAQAVDTPMSDAMTAVHRAMSLGAPDPWGALGEVPLARALRRSADSGAPLGNTLNLIADEMRRDARLGAEAAARTAGVRAVLPLVACFLPAFLLVGVVPVVASLALSLWR